MFRPRASRPRKLRKEGGDTHELHKARNHEARGRSGSDLLRGLVVEAARGHGFDQSEGADEPSLLCRRVSHVRRRSISEPTGTVEDH
jgi:hypothetical protein